MAALVKASRSKQGHHLHAANNTVPDEKNWNEHQSRSTKVTILEPHSEEWQTERAKLLSAGELQTVAFMDYQAVQGKGWNVRHTVRARPRPGQKGNRTEQRRKTLGLRVIRGGRLND
jgi:hypothetical protein